MRLELIPNDEHLKPYLAHSVEKNTNEYNKNTGKKKKHASDNSLRFGSNKERNVHSKFN